MANPLLGTGIVPGGAIGAELQVITRRAFVPKLVVQLYNATPTLAAGLGNAQTASGGISSVTVPVQGKQMLQAQAVDFSGSFNQPLEQQGIFEADYNLKGVVVPIGFLGMEGLLQLSAAVIPRIEAKMNDSGNQIADYVNTQMWNNATNGTINIDGWPLIAGTTGTYGNIDRVANTWWQANVPTALSTVPATRQLVMQVIISAMIANFGEMPNMGVMGPKSWLLLSQDFIGQEQYMITPGNSFDQAAQGARSAFTAVMVAGVPIFMDITCPEGQLLLFNTRYHSFYIHEAAAFAFTGFASTLPNLQLGYVGALVCVLEHINVKPKSVTLQSGFQFPASI
jgi:hypothetical protein